MLEQHLLRDKKNGVATITINRPGVQNVLTGEMYRDLAQSLYDCLDMEYLKAISFMGNMMAINVSSDDCAEGIAAFFQKRKPVWKGR